MDYDKIVVTIAAVYLTGYSVFIGFMIYVAAHFINKLW